MINNPPFPNRDPYIKALKIKGFINHGSTLACNCYACCLKEEQQMCGKAGMFGIRVYLQVVGRERLVVCINHFMMVPITY